MNAAPPRYNPTKKPTCSFIHSDRFNHRFRCLGSSSVYSDVRSKSAHIESSSNGSPEPLRNANRIAASRTSASSVFASSALSSASSLFCCLTGGFCDLGPGIALSLRGLNFLWAKMLFPRSQRRIYCLWVSYAHCGAERYLIMLYLPCPTPTYKLTPPHV